MHIKVMVVMWCRSSPLNAAVHPTKATMDLEQSFGQQQCSADGSCTAAMLDHAPKYAHVPGHLPADASKLRCDERQTSSNSIPHAMLSSSSSSSTGKNLCTDGGIWAQHVSETSRRASNSADSKSSMLNETLQASEQAIAPHTPLVPFNPAAHEGIDARKACASVRARSVASSASTRGRKDVDKAAEHRSSDSNSSVEQALPDNVSPKQPASATATTRHQLASCQYCSTARRAMTPGVTYRPDYGQPSDVQPGVYNMHQLRQLSLTALERLAASGQLLHGLVAEGVDAGDAIKARRPMLGKLSKAASAAAITSAHAQKQRTVPSLPTHLKVCARQLRCDAKLPTMHFLCAQAVHPQDIDLAVPSCLV